MSRSKLSFHHLLLLPCLISLMGCASASDKYFNKKSSANVYVSEQDGYHIKKIAIMPFKAPTELIGGAVSDLFVTEMLRTGRYTLVERSQMANILGESELALAGLTASEAAEVARLAGADGVLIGTVIEYQTQAYRGRTYPVVGISARMIDASTSQIVWSADYSEQSEDKRAALSQHARHVVHEIASGVYNEINDR